MLPVFLSRLLVFFGVRPRRAFERLRVPGKVHVSGLECTLLDISNGGFGFLAPASTGFLVGVELHAELEFAGARIPVKAKVVGVASMDGRRRLGCQFGALSPEAVAAIAKLAS